MNKSLAIGMKNNVARADTGRHGKITVGCSAQLAVLAKRIGKQSVGAEIGDVDMFAVRGWHNAMGMGTRLAFGVGTTAGMGDAADGRQQIAVLCKRKHRNGFVRPSRRGGAIIVGHQKKSSIRGY
ncbi:hypothetical protein PSQ19_15375 [Devosia algicola]|uniref:Uncharacterized protein n=1 Tax=Devosia algicola TaxID=3026418 RepID=A0ABY7YLH2_9HYPH|nr:hypothetical protein [Devosia algicola]WDR02042.1 hypothetical protein PSQ19_15375 [Devosia algicola]